MKHISKFFTILGLFFIIILMALLNQQSKNINAPTATDSLIPSISKEIIQKGFQKGDVSILYPHFDELISICINGEEAIYLAYNAQTALLNFFNSYPPQKFELSLSGKSNDGRQAYFIGDYLDSNNNKIRITIFSSSELIQNIEINNETVSS